MLQSMRDNMKGTVAFIIVGFLAFILAASLINLTGTGAGGSYSEVAEVNGRTITERELQIALGREMQRLQAQFGNNLPAEFLSEERLRGPVLQGLVERSVMLDKALDGDLTVSDSELDSIITRLPEFQLDGGFNAELFVQGVRRIGHTPVSFRSLLRDDVVVSQIRNAISTTAFITETELEKLIALSRQTRDFSWVSLPLKDLPETMVVSDQEVTSHYEANKQGYNTEEQVSVEYIQLTVDDIVPTIEVSEEDIEQQYQSEVQAFSARAEREAAHIMIEGDDEAAQDKITQVQQKLNEGEDFAALAAEFSDDFGSRENGGNLGVTTGDAFPEAFEEALQVLSVGEVSAPLEIDGATHFIKLLSVTDEAPPSFEESKARIEQEVKRLQAEQIFIEKLTAMTDIAYNAENLAEVGEQLSLPVGTTGLFTRAGGDEAILNDNRVVTAAFSDQVLQQGFTSDVLELSPDRSVVINLIEHQPVRTLTLEEKAADITAELKLEKAKVQLAEQADSLKAALSAGTPLETLAEENGLTLNTEVDASRDGRGQPSELLTHIFSLPRPVTDQPVTSSLYLTTNDYALVSLSAVNDAVYDELTAEEQRGAKLALGRSHSADEYRAWTTLLVDKADVEIRGATAPN